MLGHFRQLFCVLLWLLSNDMLDASHAEGMVILLRAKQRCVAPMSSDYSWPVAYDRRERKRGEILSIRFITM